MHARRPILLGIVGDSAAGKSTIAEGLRKVLGEDRVTVVCTDDYHKYDRRERAALGITPLHPECNYIDILELHLERLHYGQPILKPVYDHTTGSIVRPEYVKPKQFVIVEGLLGFHTPVMRQFYDAKVYLDPPEELRRVWKLRRDVAHRGYTPEQVLAELERREPDSAAFIRPQRAWSDIVVRFYPPDGVPPEEAGPDLNVQVILRPTIPHPDLASLLDGQAPPGIRLELGRDMGRPVDILTIDGAVASHHAHKLAEAIWRHLPDLSPVDEEEFGQYRDLLGIRHSHPLALTQLLLVYHLLRRYGELQELPLATPVAAMSRLKVHRSSPTA
jgi:phosphoribulokinase